ncbi:pyridine nucleotide transhydrogenase subunit beta [Haemophilus influenzae]|uniref:Pyridine nucleotide transhydrogenase subunit beta n=1 Tax=Haemophilus influenzae TaxID=727 RepID=A0A2X1RFN2_HAEIF|nr:pyridine nucleotide transhydrogenase subunit beta [Haemophilus influenzae]
MSEGLVQAAYILAALLFIMSLAGLSKHETAKAGCWFGIVGMTIALIATIFGPHSEGTFLDHYCDDHWWSNRCSTCIKSRND